MLNSGDVQEALAEYADHSRIAELLNSENTRNREAVHKELALLIEQAIGVYEEVVATLPDADEEIVARSDERYHRKIDDALTEG